MNKKREQAHELWIKGLKPDEIEKETNIKAGTIRQWINRYWKNECNNVTNNVTTCNSVTKQPETPTIPNKTMGRPQKEIDPQTFKNLCHIQCTLEEIADIFECSIDTIERWCQREFSMTFAEVYKKYSATGKMSLRRIQIEHAKKNPAMAIFLGKVYLNQRENVEIVNVTKNEDDTQKRQWIKASLDLWEYCKLKAPDFYTTDTGYLKEICKALQDFEEDENELLIINAPPRHGKTRTAILASQWFLGRNSKLKLITASYNEKLSRQFSKAVRDGISEVKADESISVFSDIFPDVKVQHGSATMDLWRLEGSSVNNYLATSPKATLTGMGGEIIIIDDMIKDAYEANHRGILDEQFKWFTDTLYSRLEGKAKLIMISTRWATKDLTGRVSELYKEQNRKIRVISKKANDNGKMLNPLILNTKRYNNLMQTIGEDIFRANYDQEPIDIKGKLYGEFITYKETEEFKGVYSICDTADTGTNYLCNIIYGLTKGNDSKAFVLDVYYTQENMDVTEKELVRRLKAYKVEKALFESNNGGKEYMKVIKMLSEQAGNEKTLFSSFTQTKNKEARILANSTNVIRNVYMPENWNKLFPKFYRDVTEFQRMGGNLYDDAPDCLTLVVEKSINLKERKYYSEAGVF